MNRNKKCKCIKDKEMENKFVVTNIDVIYNLDGLCLKIIDVIDMVDSICISKQCLPKVLGCEIPEIVNDITTNLLRARKFIDMLSNGYKEYISETHEYDFEQSVSFIDAAVFSVDRLLDDIDGIGIVFCELKDICEDENKIYKLYKQPIYIENFKSIKITFEQNTDEGMK